MADGKKLPELDASTIAYREKGGTPIFLTCRFHHCRRGGLIDVGLQAICHTFVTICLSPASIKKIKF
jgi:hypothetical protein